MSLEEIEWTESEGDTDDNLALEDYSGGSDDENELDKELANSRAAGGRTRKTRDEELDPEVEMAYQDARNLYTSGDYDGALALLEEAIKHEAGSKLLFNLLVSIHEEKQDLEKALLARIAVAHLDKRDKDTWIDIAERSENLGHLGQAAVFFQHVSRLDRGNWGWLWKRADLHLQINETSAALTLLQRIRTKFFAEGDDVGFDHQQKTQVLLTIASALKDLGRIDEATAMYVDLYNQSLASATSNIIPEVELDWQNLNVLCELLADQKRYSQVITIVKNGARYIQGRVSEVYWHQFNQATDAEFDARRESLMSKLTPAQQQEILANDTDSQFEMPIDIRIWLLEARLRMIPSHLLLNTQSTAAIESLPTVEDAVAHMGELKECLPVDTYSDLYRRGATAFFEARLYSEARELYISLTEIPHETVAEYLEMTVQVAKCEMELNNVERAENLYSFVLEKDSSNLEALVAIGEIYAATNRSAESRAALLRLEAIRNEEKQQAAALVSEVRMKHSSDVAGAGNIFVGDAVSKSRTLNSRPTRAERADLERNAQARADAAFSGLARFRSGLDTGNSVAVVEWLRYADELVDMFASHRKFFPADRQKDFFALVGNSNSSIDQRMARLRLAQEDQYQEDELDDESMEHDAEPSYNVDASVSEDLIDSSLREPEKVPAKKTRPAAQPSRDELEETYIWRGQPLSTWFLVFMQSALVHAKKGNSDRAQQIVMIAQAANVFNHNTDHFETMQFVALSCASLVCDSGLIGDLLRHMQTQHQFNPVTFKLYVALLTRGKNSLAVFGSSNNQKFFLRQIKALDSVVHHHRPVTGMAKVIDPDNAPDSDDPQLLMLYVYIMLLGPSYAPALTYLIRTRGVLPNHPLVLLVYGIVQMHRSTQRTSINRHLQFLEGLSFMQDYVSARSKDGSAETRQECSYNLGRFFHGVGLLTHAARYYEDALALSREIRNPECNDMGREAAYNLHLIYAGSGNMELSAAIVGKHLVI